METFHRGLVRGSSTSLSISGSVGTSRLSKDSCARPSIELLQEAGFDFELYKTQGIDPALFGEHMFTAGTRRQNRRLGAKP
jgi:hypothetical protein